ncbi:potassium-transporting ATPase subunit KdpC [Undibacterium sp. SXout20W]|uniref:potassium-transporting ATPase subunit KdpC n=1 Tax=Undibacterium sp. SXout20W TaxID=3413051 RepID=UPI003BEFBA82
MKILRPLVASFVLLTAVTGIVYPLAVTGVGKVAFSNQANGSIIEKNGKIVGSKLIGQNFSDPKNFWGRPSGSGTFAYNGLASGGSNQGPTNPALKAAIEDRIKALHDADPENKAAIPVDLVTASGSGLDPEISPAAATYQAQRVAKARGLKVEQVRDLIASNTKEPQFGLFGEARVNVLELNLALDQLH